MGQCKPVSTIEGLKLSGWRILCLRLASFLFFRLAVEVRSRGYAKLGGAEVGQVFAVTGVANGIGAELARLLNARGDTVIGFDVVEPAEHVDVYIPMDLDAPHSIAQAALQAPENLDGLCNIAGLPPRSGQEANILQVNFLGQRQFTHAMLPRMNAGASIVNMASRAGGHWREAIEQNKRLAAVKTPDALASFLGSEDIDATRAYNLSKEAMILWTMAMTEDMIQAGLRINSVSPGAVETRILDDFAQAFGDKVAKNVARTGRPGAPAEIAQVAAFLLSKESNWINGADIAVDGGMGGFNLSDALDLAEMKSAQGGSA